MATIGVDCELILDGTGYFVEPGTFLMQQPRIRKAQIRADGNESYVDIGPSKRVWKMIIVCLNDLLKYDGTPTGTTGQQYRDALRTSYAQIATLLTFVDPLGTSIQVHFDHYAETVMDLHTQQIQLATGGALSLSYKVAIELVEA